VSSKSKIDAVIIGAGPAGITAGVELLKSNKFNVTLLEQDEMVGGLSRTVSHKNCKFDIGPHHFIAESEEIWAWWRNFAKNDFMKRFRFTRIYYRNHFFKYPLEPINALIGLSLSESIRCVCSYFYYRLFQIKNVKSFQDWVTNRFGHRLFSIFFKTYTEKLWGISCTELSADWASQRIKTFSLFKAIFFAFFGKMFKKHAPRTINSEFYYPEKGAGSLWSRAADSIKEDINGRVFLNEQVVGIEHDGKKISAVLTKNSDNKHGVSSLQKYDAEYFFSTMPLRDLIMSMDPVAPREVVEAAKMLRYRGLITVNLVINKADICPDHWVYVHEKNLKVTRFENMNNFSFKMVDKAGHTALSLEYFSYLDEALWKMSDDELVKLGSNELVEMNFVKADEILSGMVVRTPEAYPVYNENYHEHLSVVRDYLSKFNNLHLIGRNGTHGYDNMDIAMLSAMSAVKKVIEKVETKKTIKKHKVVSEISV